MYVPAAGYGFFGDAQSDYQAQMDAYNAALAQQAQQDADYKNASLSYAQRSANINAQNSAAQSGYNAAVASWQTAKTRYQNANAQRNAVLMSQSAASSSVLQGGGVAAPPGYGGCISATQQAQYAGVCNNVPTPSLPTAVVVRGIDGFGRALYGFGATGAPECTWQKLPVCKPLPPQLPDPGPGPTPPVLQQLPPPPVEPAPVAIPPVPVPPGAAPTEGSFAVGGLLALVIVGGGVAYYLSTRKKKAA